MLGLTFASLFITLETVFIDTPATVATSLMVILANALSLGMVMTELNSG